MSIFCKIIAYFDITLQKIVKIVVLSRESKKINYKILEENKC